MKPSGKWFGAVFLSVYMALSLMFPRVGLSIILRLPKFLLPFVPLILYGIVAIATRKYLWIAPMEPVQGDLDKQQAASLTLAGFSFTSLNLIISFFKTEIASGNHGPQQILFYLSLALACFVASYMTLRYRTKNIFPFLSDGLIDSGFWSIMIGLLMFYLTVPGLEKLSLVFFVLLAFYLAYIALHFYYHIQYARKKCP
jgi:hypothetical protein